MIFFLSFFVCLLFCFCLFFLVNILIFIFNLFLVFLVKFSLWERGRCKEEGQTQRNGEMGRFGMFDVKLQKTQKIM